MRGELRRLLRHRELTEMWHRVDGFLHNLLTHTEAHRIDTQGLLCTAQPLLPRVLCTAQSLFIHRGVDYGCGRVQAQHVLQAQRAGTSTQRGSYRSVYHHNRRHHGGP